VGKAPLYIRPQTVKNLPVNGALTNMCLEINSAASSVEINVELAPILVLSEVSIITYIPSFMCM